MGGSSGSKIQELPAPHRPGDYRTLTLYTATYNVADQGPCKDNLSSFCGLRKTGQDDELPDIVALALQEHEKTEEWIAVMKDALLPNGYCAVKQRKLWAMLLIVFIKFEHLGAVQNIESEVTRSGVADIMGDKGAVSIRMDIYGINFIIVGSHLSAHLHENKERVSDFWDIVSNQKFRDPDVDKILDHDFIFWMGDLNFRINDIPKEEIEAAIADGKASTLIEKDQLKSTIIDSGIFDEFEEGDINFNPTFKFDPDTDTYDTSKKQRKPAWTDRVLYKANQAKLCEKNLKIELLEYGSYPEYKYSDHKPVFARFKLTVPGTPPADPVNFVNWRIKQYGKNTYKAAIVYKLTRQSDPKFSPRHGDSVRLYSVPFADFDDCVAKVTAATADSELDVENLEVKLKVDAGVVTASDELLLAYWSTKKNCPATISPPFKMN